MQDLCDLCKHDSCFFGVFFYKFRQNLKNTGTYIHYLSLDASLIGIGSISVCRTWYIITFHRYLLLLVHWASTCVTNWSGTGRGFQCYNSFQLLNVLLWQICLEHFLDKFVWKYKVLLKWNCIGWFVICFDSIGYSSLIFCMHSITFLKN